MKRILSIVGTRPQIIKLNMIEKNLWKYPELEHAYIYTGQHYSEELKDKMFKLFKLTDPVAELLIGETSEGDKNVQNSYIKQMSLLLKAWNPDMVLIYGDCNTSWLGAEAAMNLNIPIAHIEAGARCGDWSVPEERNRILIDKVSLLLFCATQSCVDNLSKEGITQGVFNTGDIMYDSYLYYQSYWDNIEVPNGFKFDALLTIHREENNNKTEIEKIFKTLEEKKQSIYFPCHPKVRKTITDSSIRVPKNINMSESIDYAHLQYILRKVKTVYTDSGGLTREAFFANKEIVVLRYKWEWQEIAKLDLNTNNPFGDGRASVRMLDRIMSYGS
jgi:UDP-GlcNAc3NAcA epimerase